MRFPRCGRLAAAADAIGVAVEQLHVLSESSAYVVSSDAQAWFYKLYSPDTGESWRVALDADGRSLDLGRARARRADRRAENAWAHFNRHCTGSSTAWTAIDASRPHPLRGGGAARADRQARARSREIDEK